MHEVLQPKRTSWCWWPWLSVCSTSTGESEYLFEMVRELVAWLDWGLVSDHVLTASPTLPVMLLALSSSSFGGSA